MVRKYAPVSAHLRLSQTEDLSGEKERKPRTKAVILGEARDAWFASGSLRVTLRKTRRALAWSRAEVQILRLTFSFASDISCLKFAEAVLGFPFSPACRTLGTGGHPCSPTVTAAGLFSGPPARSLTPLLRVPGGPKSPSECFVVFCRGSAGLENSSPRPVATDPPRNAQTNQHQDVR